MKPTDNPEIMLINAREFDRLHLRGLVSGDHDLIDDLEQVLNVHTSIPSSILDSTLLRLYVPDPDLEFIPVHQQIAGRLHTPTTPSHSTQPVHRHLRLVKDEE